jgi:hypothetical protein
MNPSDDQLNDPLDDLLAQWESPVPPADLRAALSKSYRKKMPLRGWGWMLAGTVRLPVPFALAGVLAILSFASVLVLHQHAARPRIQTETRVVVQTQKIEVPVVRNRVVVRTQYRDRPHDTSPASQCPLTRPNEQTYQFVTALDPHIVRRDHDEKN